MRKPSHLPAGPFGRAAAEPPSVSEVPPRT